ncbi:hypothetical protein FOXG_16356 [Fusarium oxysporum f. sp. lycopersici 4287]|uniref:BZIP domain-containing protein n=2 Tax=Fusarium oxysporum TaxID=5507 RepID=A0A0J9W8S8_FUSO4|nr:hypothetical protein FOXG_06768 [Fusarium oxysporum f. sp. lycopersici 4287]XP_018244702.1 hypothetical protein FOXG_07330 [Fusarium oxysporum f. sp. lycopersici 4287]XP_018257001.1 uncharacterized protein FOXG_16356 [Fusarium oxysporum f. sp. lycopersici 4287]KNB04731.1 hypothetical protein FOXG_06768 [Fusarium oxysporum f. sp. lycopersici 4287]KNB06657.1 hypothetical protein FOXG_07330 [Fusarium oxysporum f. sp. lycopersici 4287]KNB18956.1 hypothetical protein FOXG_16356 [Fusarium oxyspor
MAEYSTQWASSATSMQGYPIPSPATESTCSEMSTGGSESRRGSSSTQSDKHQQNTNQPAATKSTRRGSSKKKEAGIKDNGRKTKARAKAQPAPEPMSTFPQSEGMDDYNRRIQQRNRIALYHPSS